MTTGVSKIDRRYVHIDTFGGGGGLVGELITKSWSGGNAVSASVPRQSYPRIVRSPKEWADIRKANVAAAALRAKRRVLLPPMPYSMVKEVSVTPRLILSYSGGPPTHYNANVDYFGPVPTLPVSVEYEIISRLRNRAYGTGFNPAVAGAEGREALEMIANGATRIRKAIGSLIRQDWRGVARHLSVEPNDARSVLHSKKNISSQWLELSYGWTPLATDIEDGAGYLGYNINLTNQGPQRISARKTHVMTEKRFPAPNEYCYTTRVTTFKCQYIIYGCKKSPTFVPSLATVASVVWEKLPYSFIADWVVPVGSYIEACRTASDLKGQVVKSVLRVSEYDDINYGSNVRLLGYATPFGGPVLRKVKFDRTVENDLTPTNPFVGVATGVDEVFKSWKRAANAVALLSQRKWFK